LVRDKNVVISLATIVSLGFLVLFGQIGMLSTAANAAQDLPVPSDRQLIDASLSGPIFLDAYWVNRDSSTTTIDPARKEVGPSDGTSTLAVVLANRGYSVITAITGTLTLPEGFSAHGSQGEQVKTAQASFNQILSAGSTFTLYFDVNVSSEAQVGQYTADLKVRYSLISETGDFRETDLSVPFRLTGKVILDPVVVTRNLVPGVSNDVKIAIRNSGSAPAAGVVVSITGININGGTSGGSSTSDSSGSAALRPQITSFGTNTFSLGTIAANSNATLTTSLFPNIATGGNAAGIQLEITYNDANGNSRSLTPSVGVVVLQNAPSIIGVRVSSGGNATTSETDNRIVAGKTDKFVLEISNKGAVPITNAVVTIQSSSTSLNILGDSKWALERIDAHSQAELQTLVFAATSLIGNPATFEVTIDYLLDGSPKTEKYVLGTYVDGEISLRIYDLTVNFVGGTPTLVGNILNEGNSAALFTTIEIVPPTTGGGQSLAVTENNGNTVNGSNQIGGSNTNSRNFTRQFSQPPSPQYLGDVTANSPLPFSMPLTITPIEQQQGGNPVTLKVTYKDSLRNSHELVVSGMATLAPQSGTTASSFNPQGRNQRQEIAGLPLIAWIGIGIAMAAAAIFYILFKRNRTKIKKSKGENAKDTSEKRENIEDILKNPQEDGKRKGKQTT
jgi:hypothetical protein